MIQNSSRRARSSRILLLRLGDQGLWSAAFFLFNLLAAQNLTTATFAALTVATSTGVIAAACVRAFAIDGRVVAGSKVEVDPAQSLSPVRIAATSGAGAVAASVAAWAWLCIGTGEAFGALPLLAGLIVLADAPHYGLTIGGRYGHAVLPAIAYAATALGALFAHLSGVSVATLAVWAGGLILNTTFSWLASRGLPWGGVKLPKSGVEVRMSAEALYAALGSQLGILVLFLVSSASDTAGIRLAYSIVFAPIFSIIQGLTPLLLTSLASKRRASTTLLPLWLIAGASGVVLSGAVGFIIATSAGNGATFKNVIPFLLPVGASMLGSFILDAGLLQLRLRVKPQVPHRIRLVLVSIDIILQLSFTYAAAAEGLTIALCIGASLKILTCLIMWFVNRRPSRREPSSEA